MSRKHGDALPGSPVCGSHIHAKCLLPPGEQPAQISLAARHPCPESHSVPGTAAEVSSPVALQEDMLYENMSRVMAQYRGQLPVFADDIQGIAAVVIAGEPCR